MSTFALGRSDVRVMLWHMALYGLGAILEEGGFDVRLSWTSGMQPHALVEGPDLDDESLAEAVREHARTRATEPSWVLRDVPLKGTARGLMSPRITPLDETSRVEVQDARHVQLSHLTDAHAWLDLRMLAALGEPAYWSRNRKGDPLQDDGATRLEMQPRNQGSEFVGSRLRKLARTVAARELAAIENGLRGVSVHDEAEKDSLSSRTATGFANPGPTDNAVAWCALWGISQLPIGAKINATASTSGHIGRGRTEWFYLPVWEGMWRPARLRSILASAHLRCAASAGLPERWGTPPADLLTASSWLSARGVKGTIRFPIGRFGSDSAPERRALLGEPMQISAP